jgi:hypothetical protein
MRSEAKSGITVAIFAVFLVGLGIASGVYLLKERRPQWTPPQLAPAPASEPAPAAQAKSCPELAGLNPALVDQPIQALESALVTSVGLPPSSSRQYLESLKGSLVSYAPEKRDCMYRVLLIQARGSAAGVRKGFGTWGLDRPGAEIARLFLTAKLAVPRTRAQREDLLAQIEEYTIPALQAKTDGDREYWRRLYYGLLLICEASDDTLHQLEAERPQQCLRFTPREQPRPWQPDPHP